MGASHTQTLVRVRAPVDEGIASLVEALNELPGVYTTQSCEGREDGGAFVWFRRHEKAPETATFLVWLAQQIGPVRGVRLAAEWGGGDTLSMELRIERPALAELEAAVRALTGGGRT
jgi:hypothetical protein